MTIKRKPKELHPVHNRSEWSEAWRSAWHGDPPKLIGETAITGVLNNRTTKAKVTMRINKIINEASEIKIGVMGDTTVRMDGKDYRSSYDFVTRVYKTTNKETAINYEVELIKKFKNLIPK